MYDVIIVGARVAGAPTAMLLARRGLKVLVVDRATFPSDTLSTHQVQLPGVARLARWGVLDAVLAAGTPVTRDVRFDQGDTVITGRYPRLPGRRGDVQPAAHAARPGAGGRGPGRRRRGQGELRGRGNLRRRPGHRHPRPGEGRARGHRAGAPRHRRGWQALAGSQGGRRSRLPHQAAAVDRVLHQPYGPGWALVGDVGLLLDPITGQGISQAFRDAELLADAVADGLGGIRPLAEALRRYHRARDRAARPMYDFTARLAAVSPPTPAEIALFRALARRQEDADMFVGALAGSVPLRQFMSPRTMVRLVGMGGSARLILGQARPHRTYAAPDPQFAEGSTAPSAVGAGSPGRPR